MQSIIRVTVQVLLHSLVLQKLLLLQQVLLQVLVPQIGAHSINPCRLHLWRNRRVPRFIDGLIGQWVGGRRLAIAGRQVRARAGSGQTGGAWGRSGFRGLRK